MDRLGMLNVIQQSFKTTEGYLVSHFEVALPAEPGESNRELRVIVRESLLEKEYVVTLEEGSEVLGEAGPEASLETALRNAKHKAQL